MASAKSPDPTQRLKKQFKLSNSALRTDWNQHYNTVSGPSTKTRESFNKDFLALIPVPEDHHVTSSPTKSTPPTFKASPFSSSSNKSVFRKPNFFGKSKESSSSTSANIPAKPSKAQGKMKNIFSSIRQRSKSSVEAPSCLSASPDVLGDNNVFTSSLVEGITPLSLSDYTLNNHATNNINNNNYSNNNIKYNINEYHKYPCNNNNTDNTNAKQTNNNNNNNNNNSNNNNSNNININNDNNNNNNNNINNNNNNNNDNNKNINNNNNNTEEVEIGPDQYIAYHRDRTQSDTTRFLAARKNARNKLKNLKSTTTIHSTKSRHLSVCLDNQDLCLDTRLLIWKDPKRGTRVYRMPSNSQRRDSDEQSSPDLVYNRLLDKHSCYDLVPNSSKIVVFDSRLSIKKAFLALSKNGVKAAVLWNSRLQTFTGMLTITDFIKILYEYYRCSDTTKLQYLETESLNQCKVYLNVRPLIYCCPEDTVLKAVKLLCQHRVHRLLVLDKKLGNPINVLTPKRILAFIQYNMSSIDSPPFLNHPLSSFPNITLNKVTTITYDTKLIEVLRLFIEGRISAVPVLNTQGTLINIFAKVDFSRLAYDHLYSNLDRPVRDVMEHKTSTRVDMHTVQPHISLAKAIHKIVTASVHRLVMVDDDKKVVGMVTLSDLIRCLVLKEDDGDDDDGGSVGVNGGGVVVAEKITIL